MSIVISDRLVLSSNKLGKCRAPPHPVEKVPEHRHVSNHTHIVQAVFGRYEILPFWWQCYKERRHLWPLALGGGLARSISWDILTSRWIFCTPKWPSRSCHMVIVSWLIADRADSDINDQWIRIKVIGHKISHDSAGVDSNALIYDSKRIALALHLALRDEIDGWGRDK